MPCLFHSQAAASAAGTSSSRSSTLTIVTDELPTLQLCRCRLRPARHLLLLLLLLLLPKLLLQQVFKPFDCRGNGGSNCMTLRVPTCCCRLGVIRRTAVAAAAVWPCIP